MKISTIVIVILLAFIIVLFLGYTRLPDIVSNALSKKLQTAVEIDDINLTLSSIEVEKLEISNPPGSLLPKAMTCDLITVSCPLMRYLDKNIVIDMVSLDDVYLDLEFDSKGSTRGNWTTLMSNFKNSTEPKAKEKSEKGKTVLIKKLYINNIQCDLVYRDQKTKPQKLRPIKQIVLTNVSSEAGIPMDQISGIIFRELLKNVFSKENLQNMIEDILKDPKGNTFDKIIEPFKGLFNQADELEPFGDLR